MPSGSPRASGEKKNKKSRQSKSLAAFLKFSKISCSTKPILFINRFVSMRRICEIIAKVFLPPTLPKETWYGFSLPRLDFLFCLGRLGIQKMLNRASNPEQTQRLLRSWFQNSVLTSSGFEPEFQRWERRVLDQTRRWGRFYQTFNCWTTFPSLNFPFSLPCIR